MVRLFVVQVVVALVPNDAVTAAVEIEQMDVVGDLGRFQPPAIRLKQPGDLTCLGAAKLPLHMPGDDVGEFRDGDCQTLQHVAEGAVERANEGGVVLNVRSKRSDEDVVHLHVDGAVGVVGFF